MFYWSPNLDILSCKYMLLIRSRQAQNNMVYHSSLPLLENRRTKSSAHGGQYYLTWWGLSKLKWARQNKELNWKIHSCSTSFSYCWEAGETNLISFIQNIKNTLGLH